MTVVVDHDTRHVVWMRDGHGKDVLRSFFDALGEERRASWNRARHHAADPELARRLKHSRHALWKNPEDLTERQSAKLAWIAANDPRLHRAYLLKEGLRTVYRIARAEGLVAAVAALDRWLVWAQRCRIPAFLDLRRKIKRHHDAIVAAIAEQLSNGLIESTNTKTRLIIRRGFGFRSADAVIALVMLSLGGNRPTLPRRQPARSHPQVRQKSPNRPAAGGRRFQGV